MGIIEFFHKIKIGFVRRGETSIPFTAPEKRYGNHGEESFVYDLKRKLPDCKIKRNVVIQTPEGNAEIDCLVLTDKKLFAIEIKRWKGMIVETENGIEQRKIDQWTDEVHKKVHKSPFSQINRAIYLLRKQIPQKAWIEPIVFFESANDVRIDQERVWFTNIAELVKYMTDKEKSRYNNDVELFFEQCISADRLYANAWGKTLNCKISENSLIFKFEENYLPRKEMVSIVITHHWSYDTLNIYMRDGKSYNVDLENESIIVFENGYQMTYALSKIDRIDFGNTI